MTPVEQIKQRLSIVDVVGGYIKLEKAGASYKALCPFHKERSASFSVSPTRDAYYCFGCNRGGDIFSFVEEIEGISFPEALRMLAERAGVLLEKTSYAESDEKDRLRRVMESATVFYQKNLVAHQGALAYLRERGLKSETMKEFRLGYALPEWHTLRDHLRSKGFSEQDIHRSGLVKDGERGPYDRFRGRIIFPIMDAGGHVVAFTGRIFGEQKNADGSEPAKYLNSPDGPLYDKSAILFAYDSAKRHIRDQNFAIVVEGQMDCLMAHQAGTRNTVAVSGTALTEKHLALIRRLTENIVFTLDADDAGFAATQRTPHLSMREMFEVSVRGGSGVRIAAIPDGKDPADLIRNDPEAWMKTIAESKWVIDYYIDELEKRKYTPERLREEMLRLVVPLILAIPNKVVQKEIIEVTGRRTGMEQSIWAEIVRRIEKETGPNRTAQIVEENKSVQGVRSLRRLTEETLWGILSWQDSHKSPVIKGSQVRERYIELMVDYGITPHTPEESERSTLAIKAEQSFVNEPELNETIDELLDTLEREVMKEKQDEIWKKIAAGERAGDKEEVERQMAEYQKITPRRIELENRKVRAEK